VVAEAPRWLATGGSLLFETSEDQAVAALETVAAAGLVARVVTDDDRGATVVVGTRT
jgi:release factor glutamine methyltransferase